MHQETSEICRLCPTNQEIDKLLNVFDDKLFLVNIREVIFVTTGVEILESDVISTKICQRCSKITLRMYQFRQDALKQDRSLKEKYAESLKDKGIKDSNSYMTIKRNNCDFTSTVKTEPDHLDEPSIVSTEGLIRKVDPSILAIYKNYPNLKLPRKCLDRHMDPVVSLTMGEVEKYFKEKKLNMKQFICKPSTNKSLNTVASRKVPNQTKLKKVAPIKISKRLLRNIDNSTAAINNNYECASVVKKRGRKRKIPLENSEKKGQLSVIPNVKAYEPVFKKPNNNKPSPSVKELPLKTLTQINTISNKTGASNSTNISKGTTSSDSGIPLNVKNTKNDLFLPAKALSNSLFETSAQIDPNCEDRRINSPTNTTATNSPSKSEFIESLGLIPRVFTTKFQTLFICNVCNSVHDTAADLKKHSRQHMVCQFCKRKFKSVEAKQHHVDNLCQVKKIMNSTGPLVALEKIHLNLHVRRKHGNAFSSFDPIPGLIEPVPLEHSVTETISPPRHLAPDDVIVLPDDEECTDSFSSITKVSANSSPSKPNIRIKDDSVLNSIVSDKFDKELLKDLITVFRSNQLPVCETSVQTNLPNNNDIIIEKANSTCKFKNLSEQLPNYTVPVTIDNGSFDVSYQFSKAKQNKSMAHWDDLSVKDVCKTDASSKPRVKSSIDCKSTSSLNEHKDVPRSSTSEGIDAHTSLNKMFPSLSVASTLQTNSIVTNSAPVSSSLPSLEIPTSSKLTMTSFSGTKNVSNNNEGKPESHSRVHESILVRASSNEVIPLISSTASTPRGNSIPTLGLSSHESNAYNSVLNNVTNTMSCEAANSNVILTSVKPVLQQHASSTPSFVLNPTVPRPRPYSNIPFKKNVSTLPRHLGEIRLPVPAHIPKMNNSMYLSAPIVDRRNLSASMIHPPISNSSLANEHHLPLSNPNLSGGIRLPLGCAPLPDGSLSLTNTNSGVNLSTSLSKNSTPPAIISVKFRVKNLWELQ